MSDNGPDENSLQFAWRSVSQRIAVAAGSSVALFSLLQHGGLSTASLRGGLVYLAVLLVARVGLIALFRSLALDLADDRRVEDQ